MTATAPETRARRLWLLAPPAVALLAGGLATIHIRRSLGLAEVESVLQSRRPWLDLVPVWHANASSAVHLALLKGWLHVGTSDWVARVPSVVAVALAAAVVYAIGVRLFDRRIALAAGVLFSASAFTAGIGRDAGPMALAVLAATLTTWLFVIAYESDHALAWGAYAVLAGASVYVHPACALVLLAHAATVVLDPRPRLATVTVTGIVVAALAAPGVVRVLAGHRHLVDPLPQPSLRDVGAAVHAASGRNGLLLALAAGGAAVLGVRFAARLQASKLTLLAAWAVAPLAGVVILSIARPALDPRYLAVSTPALCLLAAVGLVARLRWAVLAVVAVATLALSGYRVVQLERLRTEEWRSAVSYAIAARGAGDRIVVAPARALSAFSYYAGRDRGSLTPGGPRVFVVVRAGAEAAALAASRRAVHPPAYALRGERRFGRHLWVQEWDRTGLP